MATLRLTLSSGLFRRLRRLSKTERAAAIEQALTESAHAVDTADVLSASGAPLNPCAMARASELVHRGRALWVAQSPPTIRLLPRGPKA
jgi:hypothetical protein